MPKKLNSSIHFGVTVLIIATMFSLAPSKSIGAIACSLSLSVRPNSQSIINGNNINYAVSIKNTGKTTCRNISYSFYYSGNEKYYSSSIPAKSSGYYWYLPTLNAGAEYNFTITTKTDSAYTEATMENDACVTADNAKDACKSNTINTTQMPKSSTPTPLPTPTPISTPSPTPTPTPTPVTPISQNNHSGIWFWDSPIQMTATYADSQIEYAAKNRFNVIYLTIDDYLSIYSLGASANKDLQKSNYISALKHIVQKANSLGVQIYAEGGWRDWGALQNRWKGFALIDFVKEYNLNNSNAKLSGFQYDVEPYILPEYETNKVSVLTDYVEFIDESVTKMQSADAVFSIVIPHFYDDAQAWTPAISFDGSTNFTFNHLLNILEKKPGSEIVLMSYRNFFTGANGTQEISEVEIKEASNGNYKSKIIVVQETGNVDPSLVTYFGLSKSTLLNNLSTITSYFKKYSNYGGTDVHYIDSFKDLK